MTFYQELQLNQAGSKLMIQEAVGRRAKAWHLLVYLVKILLTMVFCVAFVTLYGWVFGAENNIVGVVVLLCLMVFRQARACWPWVLCFWCWPLAPGWPTWRSWAGNWLSMA